MDLQAKKDFLQYELFTLLSSIAPETNQGWGKMNLHQMVEHLSDFFDVSTEKIRYPLSVPEEHLPKYKEFLYSDKIFRENTKAPANILGESPKPVRTATLAGAITLLEKAVAEFFSFFQNHPAARTMHPAFGELNFDEWVMLHYKHVTHHLRQFGAPV